VLTIADAEKNFGHYDWEVQSLSKSGNVFKYRHPATKQLKVVKQARCAEPDTHRFKALENEVKFYKMIEKKRITSSLILQFHKTEQDSNGLHLHLQSMEQGSIKDRIRRGRGIGTEQIRHYARGVASAIAYLHNRQIIWNGCSADHVLLDSEGKPKISGFGSFRRRDREGKVARLEPEEVHRRLRWLAPEAAKESICSRRTDVWALGCFVVEMVTREDPHSDCTTGTQVAQKLERSIEPQPPIQEQDDKPSQGDLLTFLNSVFVTKSSERLSARDLIRKSPFLSIESSQ
jgi:serine/threonine protein kinase